MRHYVCGFLFSPGEPFVALIKKRRPKWQAGLYNGIGGHVETEDSRPVNGIVMTYYNAMVREFREETGATITSWKHFCTIINPAEKSLSTPSGPWTVHFFKAFEVATLQSPTDELVKWFNCEFVRGKDFVPNLNWLIPMALEDITAEVEQHNWPHEQ